MARIVRRRVRIGNIEKRSDGIRLADVESSMLEQVN